MNVSDLFKAPGEYRAKEQLGADYYYNNRSVYAKNFTPTRHVNYATNKFTEIVKADNVSDIRLIDVVDGNVYPFNKGNNNFMEYFYYKGKKIDYKEITKVEETIERNPILAEQGYNNFYRIYKLNEFGLEYCLCILATRVV